MSSKQREVHVIGAGPAGLAAALHLARAEWKAVVFEQASRVGARFHGDFQGLENWSADEDVADFLATLGLEVNFRCVPFSDGTLFAPDGLPFAIRPVRPLFYLVERGSGPASLDRGLLRQAIEAGAEVRFGQRVERTTAGTVIVATGPRYASAVARGLVFETSHPDAWYGFLDDRFAPGAYAYLLVCGGRATLATCLYRDFRNARPYLARTLTAVREMVDLDVESPRFFGGYIHYGVRPSWTDGKRVYYVGEAAGFQDAMWGFGLRHALLSGTLAAEAIDRGADYDTLCRRRLAPLVEASIANRALYDHLGNPGYTWVLRHIVDRNVIAILGKHHRPTRSKRLIYQLARLRGSRAGERGTFTPGGRSPVSFDPLTW